jgi:hypothetical protein
MTLSAPTESIATAPIRAPAVLHDSIAVNTTTGHGSSASDSCPEPTGQDPKT